MNEKTVVGWDAHKKPEMLVVMMTKNCNLSCSYCFVNKDNKKSELPETELKKQIVSIISSTPSIKSINFYGGEPLLRYKTIKNLIEYTKTKNKGMKFFVNTNTTLLTQEMVPFFKENGVSLIISLDGGKKTNDLFRKSLTLVSVYDRITNKIKLLEQVDTIVNVVVTPKTSSSLVGNFKHINSLGFKKIKIYPDINCDWSKKDITIFKSNFKILMQDYLSNYQNHKGQILLDLKNFIRAGYGESSNICSQIVLSNDGFVYPCKSIPCRTSKAQVKYAIKIKEEIDLNKRDNILKNIKKKINLKNKECQSCYIKPFCFCPLDVFFDCKFNNGNFAKRMRSLCGLSKAHYEVLSEAKDILMYTKDAPPEYFEQQHKTNIDKNIYQIWFSITGDCNNRCKYCFVKKEKNYMDFAVIDKGLDLLLESSGKSKKVIIFGGEPTLHFDIIKELVKLAKRKASLAKKNIEFGIGTNAVKITREQLNFFREKDIQLSITLDGKKETHDKYRITKSSKPTYKLVTKNLPLIKSRIKEKNLCCLFGVHYDEVERMFDNFMHIAKELKIPSINIEPIQNHKWTNKEIEIFKYQLIRIFNQVLQDIRKGNFYYTNSLNRLIKSKLIKKEGEYPLYKNLVIFSDGNITSNPFLYYINKKYIVGDVFNGLTCINDPRRSMSKEDIDINIINVRNHFCNKMADFLIEQSKQNNQFKKYIGEAVKRIFE